MNTTTTFSHIVDALSQNPRYIDNEGGTRSGKTYSELQLFYLLAKNDTIPTINSVLSESLPHLKLGAIRDFKNIVKNEGEWDENRWSETDKTYTFPNGAIIEFFSADNIGKVLGPARHRLLLIEANHIKHEIARQLFVRTTWLIMWDYNPASEFWVHQYYKGTEGCISTHSTYLDNQFLSPEQVKEIERNRTDENWWRVYGLGLLGRLEGVIFDFEQIDELPEVGSKRECYGMDFGFTNDPSVLIHCLIDTGKKEIYLDEVFYQTGMLNRDIADRMQGIGRTIPVFADCAEPKTIAELCGYGYNVKPCYKATKKAEQLQQLRGWRIYTTSRSINLIREFRGYTWQVDRDGKSLNEPIAVNDHAMDAFRYGCFTYIADYMNKGKYSVGAARQNWITDRFTR